MRASLSSRLIARLVLQDAVVHLPRAADQFGFPRLGQRVAVSVTDLRLTGGIPHSALARSDVGLLDNGGTIVVSRRDEHYCATDCKDGGEHP